MAGVRWLLALGVASALAACDDGEGVEPGAADAEPADAAPACAGDETRPCPGGVGIQVCVHGHWGPCDGGEPDAIAERCDGMDEDGDGAVDEGLVEPCGSAEGACVPGLRACLDGAWGPCVGAVGPGDESCDGTDEDCDGAVDEAPILSPVAGFQAPVVRGPDRLVWTGRAYAASMPGYPNWLVRFAADGTLWRSDLIGRVPLTIDLAASPVGLTMAWAERSGALMFGLSGWAEAGLEPRPVGPEAVRASELRLAGETRSTLVAWVADGQPMGLVIDPATGDPRFDAMPLGGPAGAVGLSVANNGEDGFAAAWRIGEGDAPAPVWFARMDNSGEAIAAFEAVPDAVATEAAVMADYYIDTYAVAWTDGESVRIVRIIRGAGQVAGEDLIAEGQQGVHGLQLLRNESIWALFWQAVGPDGGEVVRGRLLDRGGPLTDVFDVMPAGERFAATHGGPGGYTFATIRGDRFETRGGPIVCPAEE